MSEFTKGEWSILPEEDDKDYIRIRGTVWGGRYKIANVICLEHRNSDKSVEWRERDRKESMVNARLIAAAPELYSALESTSRELEWCIDYINNHMRKNISASDFQPPDYYDHQTCHENQELLAKIKGDL